MRKNNAPGITEKRLNNRRFRKTEEAILRAFFEEDVFIGTKDMAKKAGVARSTFYRHHRTVREIVPDYKRFIMGKYKALVRRLSKQQPITMRKTYSEILFFLIRNKRILKVLLRAGEVMVIKEMIVQLKPVLFHYMKLTQNKEIIFGVYASEMMEIICNWGEEGFDEAEIHAVLDDAMFLTDTAKTRLLGLTELSIKN